MTGRLTNKQLVAYAERGRSQGWLKNDPLKTQSRRIKPLPKPGGSALEARFEQALKLAGITGWVREHRFCERAWRMDFAWPDPKTLVCVECEGGVHDGAKRGRHIRAEGFRNDAAKYRRAAILGWIVLRVTSRDIKDGSAIDDTKAALEVRRNADTKII